MGGGVVERRTPLIVDDEEDKDGELFDVDDGDVDEVFSGFSPFDRGAVVMATFQRVKRLRRFLRKFSNTSWFPHKHCKTWTVTIASCWRRSGPLFYFAQVRQILSALRFYSHARAPVARVEQEMLKNDQARLTGVVS